MAGSGKRRDKPPRGPDGRFVSRRSVEPAQIRYRGPDGRFISRRSASRRKGENVRTELWSATGQRIGSSVPGYLRSIADAAVRVAPIRPRRLPRRDAGPDYEPPDIIAGFEDEFGDLATQFDRDWAAIEEDDPDFTDYWDQLFEDLEEFLDDENLWYSEE
jgi:hypothetical protein